MWVTAVSYELIIAKNRYFSMTLMHYERGKWCPEEDSNLHVHKDTST